MSDESARRLMEASQSSTSSHEAWEATEELSEQTDWNIEEMLPDLYEPESVSQRYAGRLDD
ncbi:hypothetical protein [Halopiger xanaduensis]|nr:hypothetical protein [Halopiger xanaduensis]